MTLLPPAETEQPDTDPRPRRILTALLIGFVAASVMGVWLVNK